jgi:hypothetical protein
MLLYRPLYLTEQIAWHLGIRESFPTWVTIEEAHVPLGRTTLAFASFPAGAIVALSFLAAWFAGGRKAGWWLGLSALLFVTSLAPSILVAPIHYELPVVFVAFAMVVYALGPAVAAVALRYREHRDAAALGWRAVRRADERPPEAVRGEDAAYG